MDRTYLPLKLHKIKAMMAVESKESRRHVEKQQELPREEEKQQVPNLRTQINSILVQFVHPDVTLFVHQYNGILGTPHSSFELKIPSSLKWKSPSENPIPSLPILLGDGSLLISKYPEDGVHRWRKDGEYVSLWMPPKPVIDSTSTFPPSLVSYPTPLLASCRNEKTVYVGLFGKYKHEIHVHSEDAVWLRSFQLKPRVPLDLEASTNREYRFMVVDEFNNELFVNCLDKVHVFASKTSEYIEAGQYLRTAYASLWYITGLVLADDHLFVLQNTGIVMLNKKEFCFKQKPLHPHLEIRLGNRDNESIVGVTVHGNHLFVSHIEDDGDNTRTLSMYDLQSHQYLCSLGADVGILGIVEDKLVVVNLYDRRINYYE